MNEAKFTIEMNREQFAIITRALELYSRLHMGQMDELKWELLDMNEDIDSYCQKRDTIEPLLEQVKRTIWPELVYGASWGVGKFHDPDVAWEMYEVLRHDIAWHDHPEGGNGVSFGTPLTLTNVPLVNVKIED